MPKSSLGRRSSTLRPIRLSEVLDQGANESTKNKEQKRSLLLKPGFSRHSRSSSVDRDVRVSTSTSKMSLCDRGRSKSQVNLRPTLTPMTPIYNHNNVYHLPTGSSSVRSTKSIDSSRLSSMGLKGRKDVKPITEKALQQEAQLEIQEFFLKHPLGASILHKGSSIRPMTTNMFLDMVNVLLEVFGGNDVVTAQDYVNKLPTIMKRYLYRGKVDKSWLVTVNVPHSWPHVLALLKWLVELNEGYIDFDVISALYPTSLDENPFDAQEDIINFKPLLPHFFKGYTTFISKTNIQNEMDLIEEQILQEHKALYGIDDEDFMRLESEIEELRGVLHNSEYEAEMQQLRDLKSSKELLEKDISNVEDHNQKIDKYLMEIEDNCEELDLEIGTLEKTVEEMKEAITKTKAEVDHQMVSVAKQEQMTMEMAALKRDIDYFNECYQEYSKIVYQEDVKIVAARNKLNAAFLEYNKLIAPNTLEIPQLKDAELDVNVLHSDAQQQIEAVELLLKQLKIDLKSLPCLLELELRNLKKSAESMVEARMKEHDEVDTLSKKLQLLETERDSYKKMMKKTTDELKHSIDEYQMKTKSLLERMPDTNKYELELEKKLKIVKDCEADVETITSKVLEMIKSYTAVHDEFREKIIVEIEAVENKLREFVEYLE